MADRWFLKIDGVEGESTDIAHKGEIDVLAWSWGASREDSGGGGTGGGGGSGRAAFADFHFVAKISKATPQLFQAAATGSHVKWAALAGVRASGKSKGAEYLKYKLSDVIVTSVEHEASDADVPIEQFSLAYSKFEISYNRPSASGKLGTATTAGWDLKANKKV
jgi:type VI secretion system secreted protein Hcp